MRCRRYFPLMLIVVAAACGTVMDSPTAPISIEATAAIGDPPPPPVDTQATMTFDGASASAPARYMLNKPGNMAWIEFENGGDLLASPDARLQYNQKKGTTHGSGLLTFPDGTVLDLSKVSLIAPEGGQIFGRCDSAEDRICPFGSAAFEVEGGGTGFLSLSRRGAPSTDM